MAHIYRNVAHLSLVLSIWLWNLTLADPNHSLTKRFGAPPTNNGTEGTDTALNMQRCVLFRKQINDAEGNFLSWDYDVEQEASRAQCEGVCGPAVKDTAHGNVSSIACIGAGHMDWVWKDAEGGPEASDYEQVANANCTCNDPLVDVFADTLVKALPAVGQVICNIWVDSIMAVVNFGLDAIPGVGEAINGGRILAIQSAKLAQYTYDAADAAQGFINFGGDITNPCGTDLLPEQAQKALNILAGVSNGYIPTGGFFRGGRMPKWKRGSGTLPGDSPKPKDKPDPSPDTKTSPNSDPTKTTPDTARTNTDTATSPTDTATKPTDTATKPTDTATTTTNTATGNNISPADPKKKPGKACTKKHDKRGPKGKGKECDGDVTEWIIEHSVASETTITKTCDSDKYPQACAHYYSAIHGGQRQSKFTCEDSKEREELTATADWKKQHNRGKGWEDFRGTEVDQNGCQADEWPPAYFVPSDKTQQTLPEWGQLIRYLPGTENIGVPQTLWSKFCSKNDGGAGNGQREEGDSKDTAEERKQLNNDLLDLAKEHPKVQENVRDGTTTTTSIYETVTYTRGVFEIDFDYNGANAPSPDNEWYLTDNPCWPNYIVPNDPGFVLLTDDHWYQTHKFPDGYDAAITKAFYQHPPSGDMLAAGEKAKQDAQRSQADPGQKRPHPGDNSGEPAPKAPASKALEIRGGVLALRDDNLNVTRRLSAEDMQHSLEVIQCKDRMCSSERESVGEDSDYLFIPGAGPPSTPSMNTAVQTFVTSVVNAQPKLEPRSTSNPMAAITKAMAPRG